MRVVDIRMEREVYFLPLSRGISLHAVDEQESELWNRRDHDTGSRAVFRSDWHGACARVKSRVLSSPPSTHLVTLSPLPPTIGGFSPDMAKTYRYSRVSPTIHWCVRRRVTRACSSTCIPHRVLARTRVLISVQSEGRGTPRIPKDHHAGRLG